MAEETATPPAAPAQQAPNNSILTSLGALRGLVSEDTQKDIAALSKVAETPAVEKKVETPAADEKNENKNEKPDSKKDDDAAPADVKKDEKPAVEKKDDKKDDKQDDEPAGEQKKSVLGLGKNSKKSDIVIETPEQILQVVKSEFGQDIKDIKGLPKFIESAKKWRADSQKVESVEKENTQFKKLWEEDLPQEFLDAATMHLQGKDFREAFANIPKFDFSKKAEKQDKSELVNHYFPGKFAKEDFDEKEPSQALEIALQASIDKFNVEKQTRETQRAALAERSQKLLEAQKTAVSSSVKALKQRFPEMESDTLNEVKSILEGGQNKVLSLLYNNDGTAKPEAAIRLTMALYGEDEIQSAIKKQETKIETKINEDILTRGADTPKPVQKSGTSKEQIDPEIKKRIDELNSVKNKKSPFL